MSPMSCPHADSTASQHACLHLIERSTRDYIRCFTGIDRCYHVACPECVDATVGKLEDRLGSACAWCFAEIQKNGYWVGISGRPAISVQDTKLLFSTRTVALNGLPARIVCIQGLSNPTAYSWVALCADGSLVRIDMSTAHHQVIVNLAGGLLDLAAEIAIEVCPEERYAAVVNVYRQHGVVVDLMTGQQTMALLRDDYHNEHCHFAIAFARHAGRTVLIHATKWNRLDISDPATGTLLTGREHEKPIGDERPVHFRDYFHGRVAISPDQRWIVDDGWVWHPVGMLSAWRIDRWLDENAWESEDGPSLIEAEPIPYFWGGQFCWISADHLAVWGYGDDDEWMIPAVRIFDVSLGDLRQEVRWFPGPEVASLVDGHTVLEPNPPAWKRMVFDRFLFSFSPKYGVSVWDVTTGSRVLTSEWFSPDAYHRGTREFCSLIPDGVRLTRLVGA